SRLLGHAAPAAARTDRARFTGERDEAFEPTRVAPHAGKAALELAAAQEFAEFALDEAGQAGAVAGGDGLRREAVEVRAHAPCPSSRAARSPLVARRGTARGVPRPPGATGHGVGAAGTSCSCGMCNPARNVALLGCSCQLARRRTRRRGPHLLRLCRGATLAVAHANARRGGGGGKSQKGPRGTGGGGAPRPEENRAAR